MENVCKSCGMVGVDDDGEKLHWFDCPELEDKYGEGDRLADEIRDNEL